MTDFEEFLQAELSNIIFKISKPWKSAGDLPLLKKLLESLPDFRTWTKDMSDVQKTKCCKVMKIYREDAGQILFHQGDEADKFYIVLEGDVSWVITDEHGVETLLNALGPGRSFGERALMLHVARSATVRWNTACTFIYVNQEDFVSLFKKEMRNLMNKKSNWVSKYIPYARYLSIDIQDRISYNLIHKSFSIGQKLVNWGEIADSLHWIISGQWLVQHPQEGSCSGLQPMVTIGPGAVINEECILFDKESSYSVVAYSKDVETYEIKRKWFDELFVDKMKEQMKTTYQLKSQVRELQAQRIQQLPSMNLRSKLSQGIRRTSSMSQPNAFSPIRSSTFSKLKPMTQTELPDIYSAQISPDQSPRDSIDETPKVLRKIRTYKRIHKTNQILKEDIRNTLRSPLRNRLPGKLLFHSPDANSAIKRPIQLSKQRNSALNPQNYQSIYKMNKTQQLNRSRRMIKQSKRLHRHTNSEHQNQGVFSANQLQLKHFRKSQSVGRSRIDAEPEQIIDIAKVTRKNKYNSVKYETCDTRQRLDQIKKNLSVEPRKKLRQINTVMYPMYRQSLSPGRQKFQRIINNILAREIRAERRKAQNNVRLPPIQKQVESTSPDEEELPMPMIPHVTGQEPNPAESLRDQFLEIVNQNQMYKESDIEDLLQRTLKEHPHLNKSIIKTAFREVKSILLM